MRNQQKSTKPLIAHYVRPLKTQSANTKAEPGTIRIKVASVTYDNSLGDIIYKSAHGDK
jgi:hypothetical protein